MSTLQQLALTRIKGVGPKTARQLLEHFGSVEAIFSADQDQLLSLSGIGKVTMEAIRSKDKLQEAEKELAFMEKHKIQGLWIEDDDYPYRLRECADAPLFLYYRGNAKLNPKRSVSIVGTRHATSYGKGICEELIAGLQDYDVHIISGLAYGIDVQAHRLALKYAIPTIGVLGHGLDKIYPANHRQIASNMLEGGGLLTEYASGSPVDPGHFPARNRIIAGLSDVTIVVEAAQKGGALITAELANSYNRDVCAFPGNLGQTYSAGCNYLIKTHRAQLIRDVDDLIYLMGWEKSKNTISKASKLPLQLKKEERQIYEFLQARGQASVDEIARQLACPMSILAITLLEMEMKGLLHSLPGKTYKPI